MKTAFIFLLLTLALLTQAIAETAANRVESAANVLNEIMTTPDKGIPEEILGSAKCIAVVPSLLKGGLGFGGAYGRGVATCRLAEGWTAPAPFGIKGGSFGLQIGGQAVDLIMVIMNDQGMQNLLASKFKLGVDASAAAGPVGRHVAGDTDWKMRAQVLTYSRARGLFAGVTLNGAAVSQDKGDTGAFYGRMIPFKRILTGGIDVPADAQPFLSVVSKYNRAAETKTQAASEPVKPANPEPQPAANASSAPAASASSQAKPVAATPATATNQSKPDPTKPASADATADPH